MEATNKKLYKKLFTSSWIVPILLFIAYITLSIISLKFSIETITTSIVKNGIIEKHEIYDYPYARKIIDIFSNLFLTGFVGILISIIITNTIEKSRAQQERRDLELKKTESECYLRELNNKINESVFDALFKKIIPKEIFQVIKKDIINSDVVRRDSEWFLDFTVDEHNQITLKYTNRYKAYNNCDKEIVNPVIKLLSNQKDTESRIEKILCTLHDKTLVSYDSNNSNNDFGVRIEESDENMQKIHYDLIIPAHHYVEYTTVLINKYNGSVQDEAFTLLPQIDLTIIATYPTGYNFRVFPLLSSELKLKLKENNRSIYKAEGGILPKQGIVYFLEKL